MLVFIYIVLMLMPNRHIKVETATDTLPYHEEDMPQEDIPQEVDPSVVISGHEVVSVQGEGSSQKEYISGEIIVSSNQ